MVAMRAQRAIAAVVLAALLGSLGLPWIGEAHQFNDDPHWAVALAADPAAPPALTSDQAGNDAHCEICHWLRTMRTAAGATHAGLIRDIRTAPSPVAVDPATRTITLRGLPARAPPARA